MRLWPQNNKQNDDEDDPDNEQIANQTKSGEVPLTTIIDRPPGEKDQLLKEDQSTEKHLRRLRLDYVGVFVACLVGLAIASYLKLSEEKPIPMPAAVSGPKGWLVNAPQFNSQSQARVCLRVRAEGAVPVYIKLYNKFKPQAGGSLLAVQIVRGQKNSPDTSCQGFRPDRQSYIGAGPGVIWQDSLAALPGLSENGILDPTQKEKTIWRPGESHDYMVTIYPLASLKEELSDVRFKLIAGPRLPDRIGEPKAVATLASSAASLPPKDRPIRCQKIFNPPGAPKPWLQQVIPVKPAEAKKIGQLTAGADGQGQQMKINIFSDLDKPVSGSLDATVNGQKFASQKPQLDIAANRFYAGLNRINLTLAGKYQAKFEVILAINDQGQCTLAVSDTIKEDTTR